LSGGGENFFTIGILVREAQPLKEGIMGKKKSINSSGEKEKPQRKEGKGNVLRGLPLAEGRDRYQKEPLFPFEHQEERMLEQGGSAVTKRGIGLGRRKTL